MTEQDAYGTYMAVTTDNDLILTLTLQQRSMGRNILEGLNVKEYAAHIFTKALTLIIPY